MKNFPKGQVRKKAELAHSLRQGRERACLGRTCGPSHVTGILLDLPGTGTCWLPPQAMESPGVFSKDTSVLPKGQGLRGPFGYWNPYNLEGDFSQVALTILSPRNLA